MRQNRKGQRGIALIVFTMAIILGIGWLGVGALNRTAVASVERDKLSGPALKAAKDALLAHVALAAASSAELYPGRMPCPEVRSTVGTAYEGFAGPFNSTTTPSSASPISCVGVGRLPWKTLGIDQIRDGYGEPLWYAVDTTTWAWVDVGDVRTINPGVTNRLSYDGAANSVVAVIIAPGPAVNTSGTAGTPTGGCAKVNQIGSRYAVPYVVANFLECGNEAGLYKTVGTTPWSNDRTISITAEEVMVAIAGAVGDRLQRQVAPALEDWRATYSAAWGSPFLPYASTFTQPSASDGCGDLGIREGRLPAMKSADCNTNWTSASVSSLLGTLFGSSCNPNAGGYVCSFNNLLPGLLTSRITLTAPNVAQSFRDPITAASITNNRGGVAGNFVSTIASGTGVATVRFDVVFPLLTLFAAVTVTIPNLPDAAVLSDNRMKWFVDNNWAAYTYYAMAPGTVLGTATLLRCPATMTNCLTLSGMPTTNGSTNDKQFLLAYTGKALVTQSCLTDSTSPTNFIMDCVDPDRYLEFRTAGTPNTYAYGVFNSTFNDRLAMCPFRQTDASGTAVTVCN